ncbi:MAG: tRNA (adenosine(37)-N6)-dimethylallyltransferase MiaA [Dialister sp.]|nr:tRNA (adenosine(37)-N6)-dimethylallyltransferase MiaA [Dialister sp.]
MPRQKLITVLGPTASGKTELGIFLARKFHTSVISGDAFQVYKHMNIGTAKVTRDESGGVPHYLVDILEPDEAYSAADFQKRAARIIQKENEAGRIPILVGGTGLYIQSLLEGYSFLPKGRAPDTWDRIYRMEGMEGLIRVWRSFGDDRDMPPDPQRMMRRLSVLEAGAGDAVPKKEDHLIYDGPVIGISMNRDELYDRINKRVHQMIDAGLEGEVRKLLQSGLPETAGSLKGIGYREMIPVIQCKRSLEEAERLIARNTRRFAKRQMTWYRRMPYIHWIERGSMRSDSWLRETESYVIRYFRGEENHGR